MRTRGGGRARRIDANYPRKKSQAPGVIGNIERFLTEGSGEGGGVGLGLGAGKKGEEKGGKEEQQHQQRLRFKVI